MNGDSNGLIYYIDHKIFYLFENVEPKFIFF